MKTNELIEFTKRVASVIGAYGILDFVPLASHEILGGIRHSNGTARKVDLGHLGLTDEQQVHGHMYMPAPYLLLRRLFARLPSGANISVVDYGCGLGRVLLFASDKEYAGVVGIEASAGLCAAARPILANYFADGRPKAKSWEILEMDARAYDPPSSATIFIFNDPFDRTIMLPVLDRIISSQNAAPRDIWAGYINPSCQEAFLEKGFTPVHTSLSRQGKGFVIYRRGSPERSN